MPATTHPDIRLTKHVTLTPGDIDLLIQSMHMYDQELQRAHTLLGGGMHPQTKDIKKHLELLMRRLDRLR